MLTSTNQATKKDVTLGDSETISKESTSQGDVIRKKVKTEKSNQGNQIAQTTTKLEESDHSLPRNSSIPTQASFNPSHYLANSYPNPSSNMNLSMNSSPTNFQSQYKNIPPFNYPPAVQNAYHQQLQNFQSMSNFNYPGFIGYPMQHMMSHPFNINLPEPMSNVHYPFYNMNQMCMQMNGPQYIQPPAPIIITRYISTYESPKILFLKSSQKKREEEKNEEEDEINSDKQKNPSRFHNLNKLFMYSILKCLKKEILMTFGFEEQLMEDILRVVNGIKDSSQRKKEIEAQSDFFNHRHYNALFLRLDSKIIEKIGSDSKEVEIHKVCFGIDILDKENEPKLLEKINLIQKCIYQVFSHQFSIENDENSAEIRKTIRGMYLEKALCGISQLAKGTLVHRF